MRPLRFTSMPATQVDAARPYSVAPRGDARVVAVGAGWIGAEAAAARPLGAPVAMAEAGSVPPDRPLGAQGGAICRDLHAGPAVVPRSWRLLDGDPGRWPVPAPSVGP
jgi:hypothetical protein